MESKMNKEKKHEDVDCWGKCHRKFDCMVFEKNTDEHIKCKKNLYDCWSACIKDLKSKEK
jgi:hypothetical protein